MSDKGLTSQQEIFAQEVANGSRGTQAYKKAYPKSEKWKESSIHCESSKMMSNTKVLQRIEELKKQLADKGMWSREQSVEILRQIACESYANNTERVNAIKELNKMCGYEAAKVLDHKSTDGSMSPNKVDSNLIIDALKSKYDDSK